MVSSPGAMPITSPVADTVAIAVLVLLHTPPLRALVSITVSPGHRLSIPAIDGTEGVPVTVATIDVDTVPQVLVIE